MIESLRSPGSSNAVREFLLSFKRELGQADVADLGPEAEVAHEAYLAEMEQELEGYQQLRSAYLEQVIQDGRWKKLVSGEASLQSMYPDLQEEFDRLVASHNDHAEYLTRSLRQVDDR